ncbi:unannotated protein [freshwater metagenome]|uniref:Unannotated protein n=1 Tax=freshwater metagenome TaxID=449393 RepID=A0A6J7EJ54_9ZZZZ|nr:5-oxoprolinase/urea amidolyase family protein [Actinomycetota bacterium]
MTSLRVIDPGNLTLVQDLGRASYAAQGVARSGAADLGSHALAQRLCGNDDHAAGLEVLLGGLVLHAIESCVIAVTGANVAVHVAGVPQGRNHAFTVPAGAEVALSRATIGMRAYVAVRGGFAVPAVLGSRSRDTLGGIGPTPLAVGDLLPVGHVANAPAWLDVAAVHDPNEHVLVGLVPGPHDDMLDDAGWLALTRTAWRVDPRSDRIGIRLAGTPLPAPASDLPSFPVLAGCVQLPGDGMPVILGPDSGVTGGYPVLGVISQSGLDALAQARPGALVRLRRAG